MDNTMDYSTEECLRKATLVLFYSGHFRDEMHGLQGALFIFYTVEFSVSVLGALVMKQSTLNTSDPPFNPPLYVNETLAGPCFPVSPPTQGIYTTIMPVAPPPEYTP